MISLALSFALAGQDFDPNTYFKSYSDKELRRAVEACGFEEVSTGKNKAKYPVVRVKDTEASDEELICAAKIIDTTFKHGEFSPELALRYAAFRAEIARPRLVATARMRFAKEPERGTPPERKEGESDLQLAKRLEAFCGLSAANFFAQDTNPLTVSATWLEAQAGTLEGMMAMSETMGCIVQASHIADLQFTVPQSSEAFANLYK